MEYQRNSASFQTSTEPNLNSSNTGVSMDESIKSNGSFLMPALPPISSKTSSERKPCPKKLMQIPSGTTSFPITPHRSLSTSQTENFFGDQTGSAQHNLSTPSSSETKDLLRSCSVPRMPFPDYFPLSPEANVVCGPPGGTPFPRRKESSTGSKSSTAGMGNHSIVPPILNLSEDDLCGSFNQIEGSQSAQKMQEELLQLLEDNEIQIISTPHAHQMPLGSSIPYESNIFSDKEETLLSPQYYHNSSIVIPPVPFNTPVTPICPTMCDYNMEINNMRTMNSSLVASTDDEFKSDLNDSRLMKALSEAASMQERAEKEQQMEKIDAKHQTLEDLLNEMSSTKQNGEQKASSSSKHGTKGKDITSPKWRANKKIRPSSRYTDTPMTEIEKMSVERRQATEYKGAMSIAEKEIIRREKINDCLSRLRQIVPTLTHSTENIEVYETTARYAAFLQQKTDGMYDREYLYKNMEL